MTTEMKEITAALQKALTTIAQDSVKNYPQYIGHFDQYVLVRVLKKVSVRGHVKFNAGEYAIASPVIHSRRESGGIERTVTVWSNLNFIDTRIPERFVDFLGNVTRNETEGF
jgi:hypothetical protein